RWGGRIWASPGERSGAGGGRRSEAGDQPLDPLVAGLERVLAQDGALGLVVELQVDPVDRVVALALLGPADELAPEAGPGGLRRGLDRLVDGLVGGDPLDHVALLQPVEQPALAVDVVVLQVDEGDLGVAERQVVLGAVGLDQLVLDHPVALAVELEGVGLEGPGAGPPQAGRRPSPRSRSCAWFSRSDASRRLASRTVRLPVRSWLISRMARIGFSSVMS